MFRILTRHQSKPYEIKTERKRAYDKPERKLAYDKPERKLAYDKDIMKTN